MQDMGRVVGRLIDHLENTRKPGSPASDCWRSLAERLDYIRIVDRSTWCWATSYFAI